MRELKTRNLRPFGQVSFVIPVYNGAGTLPSLVSRLVAVAEPQCAEWEIILVEDGSSDDSWPIIQSLCNDYPQVRGIQLTRNFGQHAATLAGARHCRFPIVVTLDDDLQHPPEQIPLLLEKLGVDGDLVYGFARSRSLVRAFFSSLAQSLIAPATRTRKRSSSFRVFRKHCLGSVDGQSFHFTFDIQLNWAAKRVETVKLETVPSPQGKSRYRVSGLLSVFVRGLLGLTLRPIKVGVFVSFLLMSVLGYAVIQKVEWTLGWYALAGLTMICHFGSLWLMIEYLQGLKGSQFPPYLVRTTYEGKTKNPRDLVRAL